MRTMLLTPLLLVGCLDGDPKKVDDIDTDPPAEDGCPTGLRKASYGQAIFGQFVLDGLGLTMGFDNNLSHEGQPSACISETEVQFLANMGNEPFAWFTFEPKAVGSHNVGGTGVFVVVDVIGSSDPTLFANSDFTTGTWTIYENDGTQTGEITNGYATNNEHAIGFNLSYEFRP